MLRVVRRGKLNRGLRERRAEARRRAMRPLLEGLEDRVVLSTIHWNSEVAPAGGAWSTPSNWVGGVAPTIDDDVIIDLANPGSVTVTANAAVKSLITDADTTFTLSSGVFTITTAATLDGSYTQTGGELTGDGTLSVGGLLTWTGGTMSGAGVTHADGGMVLGAPDGSNFVLSGRTLNNTGAATLAAGAAHWGLIVSSGGTFHNLPGASLAFVTDAAVANGGGTPSGGTFHNQGTLAKTGGDGTSAIGVALNNSGVIQVQAGTLRLSGGGAFSDGGEATVAAGATLEFRSTQYALNDGSSVSGAGRALLESGTLSVPGGAATLGNFTQTGGELTGDGTLSVDGLLTWTGGTMSGSGATNAQGGMAIGRTDANVWADLRGRTLNNRGAATLVANLANYGLSLGDGAVVNNLPGATFAIATDARVHAFVGGGTFNNQGTLAKTGGTGAANVEIALNNTGLIKAQAGTLLFSGGGEFANGGEATIDEGATLEFASTPYTLNGGSAISGAGHTLLAGGTLSIPSGAADVENYTQTGGTLTGDGTLNVEGMLTWTGGTMSGSGATNAQGGMAIGRTDANVWADLRGRTLNNRGAATLVANLANYGLSLGDGAVVNNLPGATFAIATDARVHAFVGGGTFNNQGTLAKTGGTGAANVEIVLNNTGLIKAQAGTLDLTGPFSNYSATTKTLTGGSYVVSATLRFTGADVVTNEADITLIGADSKILDTSNNDALRNLATNAAGGGLALQGGRSLTTPGAFGNAGNLTVGDGGVFTATGAFNQSGGSTNLNGGVLASTANAVNINGGLLGGSGTVNGNVVNKGQVVPGGIGGAGILSIVGDYEQTADGSLTTNLGGPNPGTGYGQLNVSGAATLGGSLFAPLVNGFAPGDGATFDVVGYGSRAGAFAAIVPQNLPAGTSMEHEYQSNALVLNAVVAPVLTGIDVIPANPSVAKGLTTQFTAVGTYNDGSTADLTNLVTWAAADASVASISSASPTFGVATGLGEGSTTITATLDDLIGSATLTVTPAVVVSIAVSTADSSLAKGLTTQFQATGTYSDNTTADLTNQVVWASANPSLATIDENGEATALGVGAVQIKATLGEVVGSTILNVTPEELVSIAVSPAEMNVAKGLATPFTATGTYTDASTRNLTGSVSWSSLDEAIATIANNGVATAKAEGTTTITASLDGFSASATIHVDPAALVSIAVSPVDASLAKGLTTQFTATGTYTDGSTADLTAEATWTTSDAAVATINAGLATAQGVGQATIKAALGAVAAETSLTVTESVLVSITLSPIAPSVAKGLTAQFNATGTYTDGSSNDVSALVSWASAAPGIASINAEGLATALAEGSATISAKIGDVVGSTVLTVTPAELVSFAVSPAGASVAKGLSRQFSAIGTYTDASTRDLSASAAWSSSDEAVATIGETGLAATLAEGSTTITATLGGWSASAILTVDPAALVSIAIDPTNPTIAQGSTAQFQATGTYTDETMVDLTASVAWSSSDATIATIAANGLATAKAEGSATITAAVGSIKAETTLNVTPAELVSISVSPGDASLAKGLTQVFLATGLYSDGSTQDLSSQVVWASSNVDAATISNEPGFRGLATALGVGSTTITATFGDALGSAVLTVTPAELVSIAIGPVDPTVAQGASQTFTATGTYTDDSTADLTSQVAWSSSDAAVATIDASGLATALGAGSTTISAALGAASASTTLTVEAAADPAVVTGTSVMWGTAGMASLETAADGLRLLPAGRSNTIGWLGINRISITLDKAATLSADDVAVSSLIGADYGPVSVIGSGTSWLITLAKPIDVADRVTITIGNADVATFTRRLDVLPGDVNDDGTVNMQDAILVRNGVLGIDPVLNPVDFLDVLGEGDPSIDGYNAVRRFIGSRLP